jgi:hypothetical protein
VGELNEQIRDLFSSDPALSQAKWEKASTELFALAHFQRRDLLYSLGWPPGYSDEAPFDFRACVSDQIVLCDAKPASGNGLALVRQEVETIVNRWKDERGLAAVQVSVEYRGTITQQVVGRALREGPALALFAADLDQSTNIPETSLDLILDRSRIEVTLTEAPSPRYDGGIQGVDALIASLAPTVEKHVKKKAKLSFANGSTPFLLVYVYLPGAGGSDVKASHILPRVFAAVDSAQTDPIVDALWLGGVVLDCRAADPPTVMCCLRKDASWPEGVAPTQFANCAGGSLFEL